MMSAMIMGKLNHGFVPLCLTIGSTGDSMTLGFSMTLGVSMTLGFGDAGSISINTSSMASLNSLAAWKRFSGLLDRALTIMRSSLTGSSGLILLGGTGWLVMILFITSQGDEPAKGSCPVTSW